MERILSVLANYFQQDQTKECRRGERTDFEMFFLPTFAGRVGITFLTHILVVCCPSEGAVTEHP